MVKDGYLDGLVRFLGKNPERFFGHGVMKVDKLKVDIYHQLIKSPLANSLPKEDIYIATSERGFT